MITVDEYFQDSISNYDFTPSTEDYTCASDLLDKVNALFPECSLRSGHRTPAKVEAMRAAGYRVSSNGEHLRSNAVDISDVGNAMDDGLTDATLMSAQLYREDPNYTDSWVHLQRVPPHSGYRTFIP